MRASDYIGISEGIRSREIKLQSELSEVISRISSLQNTLDSLESELDILEMELDAALSDTDEDGNVDMSRVGAIRARMSAVFSQIGGCQSELSEEENKKQKIETELQTVEAEKQQTLSQIQSAANVKNQNLSRLSGGLSGDYASIGQNLQSAFQTSLGQLSQAASILGGSISVATNGGTGGGAASSNQPAIKSSGNMAMVGGMGSRNSSTATSSSIGNATQSAPTELISVTPSVSHGSSKKSPQTESRQMPLHKQSGDGGNQALLSPKTVIPLSQPKSVSINNDEATTSALQGDIPSSPHTFKDYLNPANYDSNGHYTGDYRSPVTQTTQALQDYNNWSNGGGIGLPSIDLRQNGGVMQSIVPAQNIFEVLDADSPDFWNYKSRPQSDYIAMATYIPLVRKHLEAGKSHSDIEGMGGIIGACVTNYFRNPVKVMKAGDAYIHCNDGRHRTVAAQIAKVEMPVCIVQDFSIEADKPNLTKKQFIGAFQSSTAIPTAFRQTVFATTYEQRIKKTPSGSIDSPMRWQGGKRGESLCVPKNPQCEVAKVLRQYGIKGIQYKNGIPDFSPVSQGEVKINHMMGGDNNFLKNRARTRVEDYYGNFAQADFAFAEQLNSNPILAKKIGITPSNGNHFSRIDISSYRENNSMTWHELNDGETLQLVPTIINKEFNHIGGVGEINAGLFAI